MTGVQTCALDRKSTRLNSSHTIISYAVFCLKKKKTQERTACRKGPPTRRRRANTDTPLRPHPPASPPCRASAPGPTFLSLCPFFFFNDTATTEIYTLSLHDALPI